MTTPPLPLAGRSALVTGGAGGFGRAVATALAADGASVVLCGRTEPALQDAAASISAALPDSPPVQHLVADAASDEDMARATEVCEARAPLGVAVAVVGGSTVRPVLMLDPATLESDFRRNVTTALNTIRRSAAAMAPHGNGSIVCISSTAGGGSFPYLPSYSVAKAALEALVRVSADELGHLGIRVNAVRPGLVATGAAKPGMLVSDPEQYTAVMREKPLSHEGTADDVAHAVRFLAGPQAAWITGITVPVEGGSHLRRAPDLQKLARALCGDQSIDDVLAGRIPR